MRKSSIGYMYSLGFPLILYGITCLMTFGRWFSLILLVLSLVVFGIITLVRKNWSWLLFIGGTIVVLVLLELIPFIYFQFFFDHTYRMGETSPIEIIDSIYPILGVLAILTGLSFAGTAWIIVLVRLAKLQQWGWFWGTFFLSGIMMWIYLAAEVQSAQPSVPAPLVAQPSLNIQPYMAPPIAPSPLEVLQQRYARGEIDAATYDEMASRLSRLT